MKKLVFSILVLYSVTNFAQTETTIDSLHLYSSKKLREENKKLIKNAQATELLKTYEIERNHPIFLEQTLGTLAGVQVEKRTQFGGQRVIVRGYGNDQKFNNWGIKFYLNGVPITNADGVTILEDIDFSLINNIEVIKGPAGTKYGGGSGGVVKFSILPEAKNGTTLSESLTLGSFGLLQTNTKVETSNDTSYVMFNYGHLQSDGFRPRGNTNKNNYTFLGNFKLNTKQELMVYATHNNSFQGVTGQISLQDYYNRKDPGNLAYARKNSANHFISSRVLINHKWDILSNLRNNSSIFYHLLDTKRTAAGAAENSQQPGYGARSVFEWEQKISENFFNNIEFGGEYMISRSLISNYRFDKKTLIPALRTRPISNGSYFKYNNYALSVFLVNRFNYKPWNLDVILGISGNKMGYDRTDLLAYPNLVTDYNKNLSFKKDFNTEFSPQIALQKRWKKQILNLSYSQGYNTPTANAAFIKDAGIANDNLQVERSSMLDFTAKGSLGSFNYQFSAFSINIENKLTQLWNNIEKYTYWSNTGHQKNKGAELSLGFLHTSTEDFINRIEPYANFSLYDFKYSNFERQDKKGIKKNYAGNKVVGIPSTKYSIGLDLDTKIGLYIRNTFNYQSSVYTDFENKIEIKGFPQYNAKIGYKKSFGNFDLDAFFAGNNLTNHINYSFIFVGDAVGDTDLGNGYPANVTTDINPGYHKAFFFGGINVKYNF